jgi:hypothetical protein
MESSGDLAFRRALFPTLGAPVADFLLAQNPGGKKNPTPKPPPPPPLVSDEHYLLASFSKPPQWNAVADEVAALDDLSWKPTTVDDQGSNANSDFHALARHVCVPGNIRVTDTLRRFLNSLAFPGIKRHNFYGYGITTSPYTIGFAGKVEAPGLSGSMENSLNSAGLTEDLLKGLRNAALANPTGEIALLLKEVQEQHHPEAQLWLYLTEHVPMPDSFARLLARTLKIPTFIFPQGIWFMPEFTQTPANIRDRARIGIGPGPMRTSAAGTETKDPYSLDSKARRFDP